MNKSQPNNGGISMSKERRDPKIFIIPAIFYEQQQKEDKYMLKSIMLLNSVDHSKSRYSIDKDPDYHDDTYKNVRITREQIEKQIDLYEVFSFGNIAALARKDQTELIKQILQSIHEDYRIEESFFGEKYCLYEELMGVNKINCQNCWIFIDEHFILFPNKHKYRLEIEQFFFK